MSEITKEQTFFRFFLPIVGVFSLAVVGLGYGLSLTRDNNDTMNKQIAENNVKKIHALAKAHPAKFSSYEMSTLRCEIGKPGIIRTPIDCYVNGHNGEEVHLSNTRIENLVNS